MYIIGSCLRIVSEWYTTLVIQLLHYFIKLGRTKYTKKTFNFTGGEKIALIRFEVVILAGKMPFFLFSYVRAGLLLVAVIFPGVRGQCVCFLF